MSSLMLHFRITPALLTASKAAAQLDLDSLSAAAAATKPPT
jgi:hypothetical protein